MEDSATSAVEIQDKQPTMVKVVMAVMVEIVDMDIMVDTDTVTVMDGKIVIQNFKKDHLKLLI